MAERIELQSFFRMTEYFLGTDPQKKRFRIAAVVPFGARMETLFAMPYMGYGFAWRFHKNVDQVRDDDEMGFLNGWDAMAAALSHPFGTTHIYSYDDRGVLVGHSIIKQRS